jgi:hypothetical protein
VSNIYIQKGYKNRRDYLKSLAEDYGVSYLMVFSLANILGENEDFDGLISELDDMDDYEDIIGY